MTNLLADAAKILETSWCRGSFRHNAGDDGIKFCGVGALVEAKSRATQSAFGDNLVSVLRGPDEVHILADTIIENYPNPAWGSDLVDRSEVIIDFNDYVAKSSDEVIAMFEKAAVKWEEINGN